MASGTDDLDNLIALLAKLPGLGPRSARRAVLHLIKKRSLVLIPLAEAMHRVGATARECLTAQPLTLLPAFWIVTACAAVAAFLGLVLYRLAMPHLIVRMGG